MKYQYRQRRVSASFAVRAKQVLLPGLLIAGVSLLSAKDAFYFDNGSGGAGWKIGKPKVSLLNAHGGQSLPEVRQLALELVNRDRQLNGLLPLVEDPLLSQSSQQHSQDMMGSGLDLWIGSDIHTKFVAVDEQTNDHIVQPDRLRKANGFAS